MRETEYPDSSISIHAPVKGATTSLMLVRLYMQDFNPRSREGSDICGYWRRFCGLISIHAPVKGAT